MEIKKNKFCPECNRPGTTPEVSPGIKHYYKDVLYCENCKILFSANDRDKTASGDFIGRINDDFEPKQPM